VEQVGPYQVFEEIARGGQGVVLKARHASRGTVVALKLQLNADPQHHARFQREAETLARLSHPNLLAVDGFGQLPNGTPFLAMEFVRGRDLSDMVRTHGRLGVEDLAEVLLPLADVLHYCHEQGVVHRDVKPQNVMLEAETGRVLLVDFGLIKRDRLRAAWSTQDRQSLTQEGTTLGTPSFMPPEQVSEEYGRVDARSDVYALGALLYFLLTGRKPFDGESTVNVLMKVMSSPAPDPRAAVPSVPAPLAELCLRCMAKDMSERPASAAEFADALRVQVFSAPKEGGGLAVAAAAACLALVALLGVGLYLTLGEPEEPGADSPSVLATQSPTPRATVHASPSVSALATPSPPATPGPEASPAGAKSSYDLGRELEAKGGPEDLERARDAYLRAAERGHTDAAYRLGLLLERTPEWRSAAVRWFRRAAEAGSTQGMNRLGRAYQDGRGVPYDRAEALKWHRRAAEAGDVLGMYSLALLLSSGKGRTPVEFQEARTWALRASRLGHAGAQFLAGRMLSTGKGGPKDGALAYRWHEQAAKQGTLDSYYYLGVICAQGNGVPKSQARAAEWYRRGAEAGHAQSMFFLARRHLAGNGVPQDRERGLEWLQRAASSQSPKWRQAALEELAKLGE
jgi:serine/threonine protein kinase/TPR repeat protein